mgnify:CR=1 FL=1
MDETTVSLIIKEWLKTNGFDGLYNRKRCSCIKEQLTLNKTLKECNHSMWCMPGYLIDKSQCSKCKKDDCYPKYMAEEKEMKCKYFEDAEKGKD